MMSVAFRIKTWFMIVVSIMMLSVSFLPHHHHHGIFCFMHPHGVCEESGCTGKDHCHESSDSAPCDDHCIVKFEASLQDKNILDDIVLPFSSELFYEERAELLQLAYYKLIAEFLLLKKWPLIASSLVLNVPLRAPPCA